jgi:hypothetical protein
MRAHENPFRSSRAQKLSFRGSLSKDELLARLATLRYRGAIVGPEGSGKTTLLRELEADLSAAGLSTRFHRFDDLALLRPAERGTILMIDGAEKLPWVVHSLLALTTPRLIVTAHGPREGLPVLLQCAVHPKLMEGLVIELAGPDAAVLARARRLFVEKRGNAREVFAALYDVFAAYPRADAAHRALGTAQMRPFPFTTKSAPSGNLPDRYSQDARVPITAGEGINGRLQS